MREFFELYLGFIGEAAYVLGFMPVVFKVIINFLCIVLTAFAPVYLIYLIVIRIQEFNENRIVIRIQEFKENRWR